MIRFSFSLLFLLFFAAPALIASENYTENNTVVLSPEKEVYPLGLHLELLEDAKGSLTLEAVIKKSIDFYQNTAPLPNLGIIDSVYWVRFTLKSDIKTHSTWILTMENLMMDYIVLHEIRGHERIVSKFGDLYKFDERPIKTRRFNYQISLKPGEIKTFYLRFETKGSMEFPLVVQSPKAILEDRENNNFFSGILYGIIVVMILYNTFLFFTVRRVSYLYYVFYLIVFGLGNGSYEGWTTKFFWPNSPWWANQSIPFFIFVIDITFILFAKSLLQLPELCKKYNKFLNFWMILLLPFLPLSLWLDYSISLKLAFAFILTLMPILIIAGILALLKKAPAAPFYLLGWSTFLFSISVFVFQRMGWIDRNPVTTSAMPIGVSIEIVLFSLALGNLINQEKNERIAAQKEMLHLQEEQQLFLSTQATSLKEMVAEKTEELQLKNQNLYQLNEEKNSFLQIAAHDLKAPLADLNTLAYMVAKEVDQDNEDIQENLSLIRKSASDMSSLVGDLLDIDRIEAQIEKVNIEKVALQEVLHEILPIFHAQAERRAINLDVNVPQEPLLIEVEPQWIKQIIKNIVSNALKFSPGKTTILIQPRQIGKKMQLSIEDQGPGIHLEDRSNLFSKFSSLSTEPKNGESSSGLGLHLVKLMMDRMGGEVYLDETYEEGARFILEFRNQILA